MICNIGLVWVGMRTVIWTLFISIFNPLRLLYFPLQDYDERLRLRDEDRNRPGIFSKRVNKFE
jgi:hypothetical protein